MEIVKHDKSRSFHGFREPVFKHLMLVLNKHVRRVFVLLCWDS